MKLKLKVNPTQTVTITDAMEMVGFLRTNGTQCQFVSMLTKTPVTKISVKCPYKNVVKVSRRNGLINVNYNMAVRRRLAAALNAPIADVEYTNGQTWFIHETAVIGQETKALPLCVNKKTPKSGKFYMQYFPLRSSRTRYLLPNGEEVAESLLEPFFYSRERDEYKPATCVFSIENIKELRCSGVVIKTEETEVVEAELSPA